MRCRRRKSKVKVRWRLDTGSTWIHSPDVKPMAENYNIFSLRGSFFLGLGVGFFFFQDPFGQSDATLENVSPWRRGLSLTVICSLSQLAQASWVLGFSGLLLVSLLTSFGSSTPEALQPPPEIVQATLQVTVHIIFITHLQEALESAASEHELVPQTASLIQLQGGLWKHTLTSQTNGVFQLMPEAAFRAEGRIKPTTASLALYHLSV